MTYDSRHNLVTTEPSVATRGVVLVLPAMATPARYYAPFATWLAERGLRGVVLEHRGTADRAAMQAYDGDLLDWFDDARDVVDVVARQCGRPPVSLVGHSLGTQMLPFVDHVPARAGRQRRLRHRLGRPPARPDAPDRSAADARGRARPPRGWRATTPAGRCGSSTTCRPA